MRKYVFVVSVLLSIAVFAQDRNFEKGEKLYSQLKYAEAIPFLKKSFSVEKNEKALHYLAYASLKTKDYSSALSYFKILAYNKNAEPVYYLEFGKLLKNAGLYNEAKPWFMQYLRKNPEDMEVRQLLRSCDMAPYLLSNPLGFGLESWSFNTAFMEFSPVLYEGEYVFTSNRVQDMEGSNYGWDNMPFLRLMSVDTSADARVKMFSQRLNGKYHVGPAVFSADGNEVFYTRNSVVDGKMITDKDGFTRLKMMYSRKENGKWSRPADLPFNNTEFSVGHPCLSADGNTLYFASDMPGGRGGVDIWKVSRSAPEAWGVPVNLGEVINTPGNELFPTLFADTLLSFSSDYHPGLGALDIFQSTLRNGKWSVPKNQGFPVNSSQDDFGMIYLPDGQKGFVSSNRAGGAGSDDVYRFKKISVCIQLTAMDSITFDLLPKATVRITDGAEFTREILTAADGKIRLCVPVDNNYQITVERPGYRPKRYTVSTARLVHDKDTMILAELVKGSQYSFAGLVVNDENDSIIAGALVKVTSGNGFPEVTESDAGGNFDLPLDPGKKYQIEVYKDNFLVHQEEFVTSLDQTTKIIRLRPLGINKLIKLQNIYYDLNKADIRPEAAIILDTLVKVMKNNPYLRIELGSHTDSRATNDYNFKLSEKRAKIVIEYLEKNGIEPFRISYKYYGETNLLTPCPDGVVCAEEEHQLNRRTEFKIIAY